jgi:acetoin utilization protein AcuB
MNGAVEGTMRVKDVMTTEVQTIRPQVPALDAWEQMRRHGIHHLVVMENAHVVGVLSDRDAGGRRSVTIPADFCVEDVMTRSVVTVPPDETVRKVANLMRGRTIGCVPVVEDEHLQGIVTVSDLLGILGRGVDRPARPPRRALHYRTPHRTHKRASGVW